MDNGAKLQTTMKPARVAPPIRQAAPKKRRKAASLDKRKARVGWLFILPFLIGFAVIYIPVIFDSLNFSMSTITVDRSGENAYLLTYVGLENYQEALFADPGYVPTLLSGIRRLILDIPAIIIFSLFMAVILNQKVLGRAAFRTIFFIPVICATGIIGTINQNNAAFNDYIGDHDSGIDTGRAGGGFSVSVDRFLVLFQNMKVGGDIATYVTNAVNGISGIINRSGVQMLVFLAGLQSISPAIYESCSIDGATTWETFWKITLPMISPMILVNSIYTVIDSFTSESNSVMRYIRNIHNQPGKNVQAAAMAWVYFVIIIAIVIVVSGIISAFVFYQRRNDN